MPENDDNGSHYDGHMSQFAPKFSPYGRNKSFVETNRDVNSSDYSKRTTMKLKSVSNNRRIYGPTSTKSGMQDLENMKEPFVNMS